MRLPLLYIAMFLFVSPALAETAVERAGLLKNWREQCNDPDTDLRLAYIEAAIESGDTSIQRICTRLALESDDADIQNLGLRAAIASFDQIVFDVQIPPQLETEIAKAGDNDDKLKEISSWYISKDYKTIKNGLVFEITKSSVENGQSTWFPLGSRASANDNHQGKATITGSNLHWIGSASLDRTWKCSLDVSLQPGARLVGEFQCDQWWAFPVSADLL